MPTAWRPARATWLDASPDTERTARVASVRAALETTRTVWVVGARSVAWPIAVAALADEDPLRVDLAGCSSPASVQVALGQAAGVWPAAAGVSASAVLVAAAGAGPFALDFVREAVPNALLVLWAPVRPDTLAPVFEIGGQDTLEGLPPASLLSKALSALPRGAQVPVALVRETGAQRGERTAVPEDAWATVQDPRAVEALAEALEPWLAVAVGQPLPTVPVLADALALEWLAHHHPDPDEAARARAAAARVWSGWHAHTHARQLLDGQGEAGAPGPAARGLVRWAEAELLDRVGRPSASALEAAADLFAESRALGFLAALRRWQTRRAIHRRTLDEASTALHEARSLARVLAEQEDRRSARQATGQTAAALALAAGERLGATAVLGGLDPCATVREERGLRLLTLEHAMLGGPTRQLPRPDEPAPPVFGAFETLRVAECARSEGRPLAQDALQDALATLQALGEDHAVAVALVLLGDAAVVDGDPGRAWECWRAALRLHIHQGRSVSSSLVLRRLSMLADEAQEPGLAQQLRDQADALRPA